MTTRRLQFVQWHYWHFITCQLVSIVSDERDFLSLSLLLFLTKSFHWLCGWWLQVHLMSKSNRLPSRVERVTTAVALVYYLLDLVSVLPES